MIPATPCSPNFQTLPTPVVNCLFHEPIHRNQKQIYGNSASLSHSAQDWEPVLITAPVYQACDVSRQIFTAFALVLSQDRDQVTNHLQGKTVAYALGKSLQYCSKFIIAWCQAVDRGVYPLPPKHQEATFPQLGCPSCFPSFFFIPLSSLAPLPVISFSYFSLPFPLFSLPFLCFCPFPSRFALSFPLEVGPLESRYGVWGALWAFPAGSGAKPYSKPNLVDFNL